MRTPTSAKMDLDFVWKKRASTVSVCTLASLHWRHIIMAWMAWQTKNHAREIQGIGQLTMAWEWRGKREIKHGSFRAEGAPKSMANGVDGEDRKRAKHIFTCSTGMLPLWHTCYRCSRRAGTWCRFLLTPFQIP